MGYDTVVEEHPLWDEAACLEFWQALVNKSVDKLVQADGSVFIAKARKIIVDNVENHMHYSSLKRQRVITNDEDLRAGAASALASESVFRRVQTSLMPRAAPIPADAKMVDCIDGNNTDAIHSALTKHTLQSSLEQDMMQAAVQDAELEGEMLEEAQEEFAKVQAAKDAAKQVKKEDGATPEGTKRLVGNLNTILIEKGAKLDSSISRLRTDIIAPEVQTEHLTEEERAVVGKESKDRHLCEKAPDAMLELWALLDL
jgi:hypothetical protein